MAFAGFLGSMRERQTIIFCALCEVLALFINYLLGFMFPHPQPFMLGLSPNYLDHAAENSFPSDHATFMWTLAFGLLLHMRLWPFGWAAVLLAALTNWARIFLGVHFPFDILGSMAVAAITLAALLPRPPLIRCAG